MTPARHGTQRVFDVEAKAAVQGLQQLYWASLDVTFARDIELRRLEGPRRDYPGEALSVREELRRPGLAGLARPRRRYELLTEDHGVGLEDMLQSRVGARLPTSGSLEEKLTEAFAVAADQGFEGDGEPEFSSALSSLIRTYGALALKALERSFSAGRVDVETIREALKLIGAVDHKESYHSRRGLLEKHLASPSARIRYAAALGLAEMDAPESIPALREAASREVHNKIRQHFNLVLDQLEQTDRCRNS